jgi:hypothetical protein
MTVLAWSKTKLGTAENVQASLVKGKITIALWGYPWRRANEILLADTRAED